MKKVKILFLLHLFNKVERTLSESEKLLRVNES